MAEKEEAGSPPADILVSGHFKEQYGYATYRSRGSGSWLITYTLQGKGLYRQPGISLWAEPGDLILLQPAALHDYSVPQGETWEFLWAHFQPRLEWLSWWHIPEVGQGLYKVHLTAEQAQERVKQAFLSLDNETKIASLLWQQEQTGRPSHREKDEPLNRLQRELALNRLEEALLVTAKESAQERQGPLDQRVQLVLERMSRDLTQHYDLTMLAEEVELSASRLSHLFKQEVGDSVNNMLLGMRLQKATRLLEFSTHSIGFIAEEVGFSSGYYFSRQFHQRFGMSPREYRDSIAKANNQQRSDKG